MSAPRVSPDRGANASLTLPLDGFAWEAVTAEAERMGATIEELVAFSVLYYLADLDSGRIARQIARSPYPRRFDRVPADRD